MSFKRYKFELLNFGKSARKFHYETPQEKQIETKDSIRDLGIIFDPNGEFNKHIIKVVAKSYCVVGLILQTFRTRKGSHTYIIKNISCTTSRTWMYYLDANFSKFSKLN